MIINHDKIMEINQRNLLKYVNKHKQLLGMTKIEVVYYFYN